jgi:hypothetical protein
MLLNQRPPDWWLGLLLKEALFLRVTGSATKIGATKVLWRKNLLAPWYPHNNPPSILETTLYAQAKGYKRTTTENVSPAIHFAKPIEGSLQLASSASKNALHTRIRIP